MKRNSPLIQWYKIIKSAHAKENEQWIKQDQILIKNNCCFIYQLEKHTESIRLALCDPHRLMVSVSFK